MQGIGRAARAATGDVFGPARVLEVDGETGAIRVMLAASDEAADGAPRSGRAQLALPLPCQLSWGDSVIVAGGSLEDLYVIGVLGKQAQPTAPAREVATQAGVRAEVSGESGEETLRVFSPGGQIIFEYDATTGKSRVDAPSGDLEFVAKNGNIDFIAAKGVRFFSREAIEMKSLEGIELVATSMLGKATSALRIGSEKLGLKSTELEVRAEKGSLAIEEAEFRGRRFSACVDVVKLAMKRSESVVETVIEKAKNAYRSVEDLSQLRAGRLRTLVEGVYQLRSKNAYLKAEENVKVKGDQIHLG